MSASDESPADDIDARVAELDRIDRKVYSGRRAYFFTGGVILATFITALIIGIAGAIVGGPNCVAGKSSFICSRAWELAFPLIPSAVSLIGCLAVFWQTYVEWKHFRAWRPWLAMCWVAMPFTIFWMISTLPIVMLGVG